MAAEPRTVRRKLIRRRDARRKADEATAPAAPEIARIARLMACAIVFDEMLARGEVRSYRELAAIGQVSPARISQVMGLLELAHGIQEQLLLGDTRVNERELRPLAATEDWAEQLAQWDLR